MVEFYMLIGLPGSGKSEIAKQLASSHNAIIISSDLIRKEFYGDENTQINNSKVFEEMQRRTLKSLRNGINVIYNATNINRKKRRHMLNSITFACTKVAYVVLAKFETCLLRDKERNHNVGVSVIKQMLLNFQPPCYEEGWDEIYFKINDTTYNHSNSE